MFKENVRKILEKICIDEGYNNINDALLEETLKESGEVVLERLIDTRRWVYVMEVIKKFGDVYISYCDERATGDGEDNCCFDSDNVSIVVPIQKTIIDYVEVKE